MPVSRIVQLSAQSEVGRAATASGYLLSPALLVGRRSGATVMQWPTQGTTPGPMTMARARVRVWVRVRVSGHGFAAMGSG